jgi:hopene-associated glycosyltransferase HpnB
VIAAVAVSPIVAAIWAYIFTARGRLADASYFDLIDTRKGADHWPTVNVVIPARNEAEVLRFTLGYALSFYYPDCRVVLVDDCSEDGTADVARQIAAAREAENLTVLHGTPPPEGWRGKLWALEQGVRATDSEWLLFLDADVFCGPSLLRELMRLALNNKYQMASLMVVLRAESLWDRLLIPAFLFFFHLLYPFHKVSKPESSVAAAAGGCVLIERAALAAAGGLEAIRSAWIDDVALAGAMKRSGALVYLGATVQAASFRRYGTLKSLRAMVTRSAFIQLRHSWALLAATLVGLAILFGVPSVTALMVTLQLVPMKSVELAALLGASSGFALSLMIAAYVPALRFYRLPALWALTLPVAALVYAAMTLESALRHSFGRGAEWKGRRAAA